MLAEAPAANAEAVQQPSTRSDRRNGPRLRTVCWLAKVTSDQDVGLWRVQNISNHGLMLQTRIEIGPGERLWVALSESNVIGGIVRWRDESHCGLEFDAPIRSEKVLSAIAAERGNPRYRPPRLPVNRGATVYSEHGLQSVRVVNVSRHGIGLAHDGRLKPEMRVKLLIENGLERRGTVRWADGENAGVLLFDPLCGTLLESRNRF